MLAGGVQWFDSSCFFGFFGHWVALPAELLGRSRSAHRANEVMITFFGFIFPMAFSRLSLRLLSILALRPTSPLHQSVSPISSQREIAVSTSQMLIFISLPCHFTVPWFLYDRSLTSQAELSTWLFTQSLSIAHVSPPPPGCKRCRIL
jgi:hypothetical protein